MYVYMSTPTIISTTINNQVSRFYYREISNTRHQITKLKCFSSRLAVVFSQSIEIRCSVENEDVVGAAPTGDAPTTSEWSTIILPTKLRLILEIWRLVRRLFLYDLARFRTCETGCWNAYIDLKFLRQQCYLRVGLMSNRYLYDNLCYLV